MDEETHVDCCAAFGGIASRSSSCSVDAGSNDGRFLCRGNDRDILQRADRPE
jgi:hypothetical protein